MDNIIDLIITIFAGMLIFLLSIIGLVGYFVYVFVFALLYIPTLIFRGIKE